MTTVAIEIGTLNTKVVASKKKDNRLFIIFSESISTPYVEDTVTINQKILIANIKSLISEVEQIEKEIISKVVVILPAIDHNVYQVEASCPVIAYDDTISESEIRKLMYSVKQYQTKADETIVSVVIDKYFLDNGEVFTTPPLNQHSKILKMTGFIHALPVNIIDNYEKIFKLVGVTISNYVLHPIALYNNLFPDDCNDDLLLIDIGGKFTNISLFLKKRLLQSKIIVGGSDYISERIAQINKIDRSLAESYKIKYAFGNALSAFGYFIDSQQKYTDRFISQIVESTVEEILHFINQNIKDNLKNENLKIVVTGVICLIPAVAEKIEKFFKERAKVVTSNIIGGRNYKFDLCIGAIKVVTNI